MIAALFVEKGGAYYGIEGVEPWDRESDARFYRGPWPVVAHPPCQLWVNMAGVNFKRYGGAHNRPGNDGGCFMAALTAVRRFGGVLEHPAGSFAWDTFLLPKPMGPGWSQPWDLGNGRDAWVCEVWQSAYGHRARKRTWLYAVTRSPIPPPEMNWARTPGTAQVGWFDRIKPTLGKREANATPPAFRDALLSIARQTATRTEAA